MRPGIVHAWRLAAPWLLVAVLLPAVAWSQDTHYWTNHYGSRAELLGGVVVGSIEDLSSTYYNPGSIALTVDPKLVLATDAVEFSSIRLPSGGGEGIELRSYQANASPSIFAARIFGGRSTRHDFAVSYLNRRDFDFEADGRRIEPRDVDPSVPGDEAFSGEVVLTSRLAEYWYGFTWAQERGERLGLGVTSYFAYRGQRGRSQAITQAVGVDSTGSAGIVAAEYRYWNLRLLWKLGLAYDLHPFTLGLAITTPSVNLTGTGSSYVNLSLVEVDTEGTGNRVSELVADYQRDLPASYRSPFSIAGGCSYRFRRSAVHFSLEWFDAVDEFNVIDTADFIGQTTGDTLSTDVNQALRSVTNWGAGVEHRFNERFGLYGAFVVDKSAYDRDVRPKLSVSSWNIYHVTVGSAVVIRGLDLTLGISHAFGSQDIERPVDLSRGSAGNPLLGDATVTEAQFRRWKFILGLSITF